MNLQETLYKLFNRKIERSNFLTNWLAKDLRDFNREELLQLERTCRELAITPEHKALSSKVRTRIVNEKIRRYWLNKTPKIKIVRNKGRKNERRTKEHKR